MRRESDDSDDAPRTRARYQLLVTDAAGDNWYPARRDHATGRKTIAMYGRRRDALEARAKIVRKYPGATVHMIDLTPGEPDDDAPEHLTAAVREVREALRAEIHSLGETLAGARASPTALLLSQREAARLLGVSRNSTLRALITNGQLKTVQKGGSTMVPRSEVERLAREGFDATALPSRRTRRRRPRVPGAGKYDATDPSTWDIRR